MSKVKILKIAKNGLIVPNPKTGLNLSETGEPIVMSTYWARRIKEGSVLEVKKAKRTVTKKQTNSDNKNSEE